MQSTHTTNNGDLALQIFQQMDLNPLDVAIWLGETMRNARGAAHGKFKRIQQATARGLHLLTEERKSINLKKAVELTIEIKKHRRLRTLREIRYTMNSLFSRCPEIMKKPVCSITSKHIIHYLNRAFHTSLQRNKARSILSNVFSVAIQHGFANHNPAKNMSPEPVQEQEICALTLKEITTLIATACRKEYQACLPALALMLYAGIRPKEVERLTWNDIVLADKAIYIRAQHSKTGGARHITIHPPLENILRATSPDTPHQSICPPNWKNRWRSLRLAAGWDPKNNPWPQDCLRHTFASYYIKQFKNFSALQWEMGHRSAALLRTRYINLRNITESCAKRFWQNTSFSLEND